MPPKKRFPAGPPADVSIRLERSEAAIAERSPGGSQEEQFVAELARIGVDTRDLDRPLADFMEELAVIECVAIAEAVWRVELGPRSGTVSEMGELAYEWPTLRAIMEAARSRA